MKFDASKSQLYQQIMEAAVTFLGLDAATATETDVHAAFDGKKPLADLIDEAKSTAVADLQKQFNDMKTDFDKGKEEMDTLKKDVEAFKLAEKTKDDRIADLSKDLADQKLATDAMKDQHKKETARLAGEIAAAKAGKAMEADVVDDVSEAGKADKSKNGASVIVAQGDALQNLTKKQTV